MSYSYRCKKYGCNLKDEHDYIDSIVSICIDCGKKYIYPSFFGVHNERKYNYDHRRLIIQPSSRLAWAEVYGDKIFKEGIKFCGDKTYEEEKQLRKDNFKLQKDQFEFDSLNKEKEMKEKTTPKKEIMYGAHI